MNSEIVKEAIYYVCNIAVVGPHRAAGTAMNIKNWESALYLISVLR